MTGLSPGAVETDGSHRDTHFAGLRRWDVDILEPQHFGPPGFMKTNDACHKS